MNRESRMEAVARDVFSQVRTSIVMKMRFLDMAVFGLKLYPTELKFATDGNYLYFAMMKGVMGADRQRNWSELGKEGRLLILFVSQIIGCYIAYVRKTMLYKDYHSLQAILDKMRPIRYIEHPNTKSAITPFVGDQVKICEAFGFEIPEG